MNLTKAGNMLQLNKSELNDATIKKAYRKKALLYHPDKCKQKKSEYSFSEINDAYTFLMKETNRYESNTVLQSFYKVKDFFTTGLDEQTRMEMFQDLSVKLLFVCENQSMQIIDNMDEDSFLKIYKLFIKCNDTFRFSSDFTKFMENKKIYWFAQGHLKRNNDLKSHNDNKEKFLGDWDNESMDLQSDSKQNIIIRPILEDIITDNVFQYTYEYMNQDNNKSKTTLLLPLWHNELVYDFSNVEFVVQIEPNLPSKHFWIDENNTLHQNKQYLLEYLWEYAKEEESIDVWFGPKVFSFYPHKLTFEKEQQWVWKDVGISLINTNNIFDVSKRGDIVLHITIID